MTETTTTIFDPRGSDPFARPPSGPAVRPRRRLSAVGVAWRLFAGVLVLGALGWGTLNIVSLLAHEERTETETFAAADVHSLLVDTERGSVRIVATSAESDEITVRAEISEGLRDTGESREVVDGVLEMRATCPVVWGSEWCRVTYEVTVPADLPVIVDADDGRVEITGTTATVTADNDNGSIVLTDVAGPIDVSTDNGGVRGAGLTATAVRADSDNGNVRLEFAVAPRVVDATTDNGSVEVVVPDDGTAYRVDLGTDNGGEELDVPTDPASARTLTLATDNGRVTARTG